MDVTDSEIFFAADGVFDLDTMMRFSVAECARYSIDHGIAAFVFNALDLNSAHAGIIADGFVGTDVFVLAHDKPPARPAVSTALKFSVEIFR